jgi:uncharacterized protein YkwD
MAYGESTVSTKKSSFGSLKISANSPAAVASPVEPSVEHEAAERQVAERAPAAKKGSAKPPKTVPVRLTHEQWYEAKEFAMRQDESLQDLFIAGLNMVRASKGLPPLSGTVVKK